MVKQLTQDYQKASISAADMSMLDYVVKLTKAPWEMTRNDVEKLRSVGFSDSAILDINQVAGYYAFANRLADGLGVELETFWPEAERDRKK